MFRTRIELRQIGARDEAKRLDGVGRCGRRYCCSSWLPELRPVSLALAKDQHLSLNPSQISGGCGRLLCCLRYEHDFYVQARRRFPKEGKTLRTAVGLEKVLAVDVFRETVTLRAETGDTRVVSLETLAAELERRAGA
jgi:cell fate regulator YaaT (PSP1 superfamily)